MARDDAAPRLHLVMVPNPCLSSGRRFRARSRTADGARRRLALDGDRRLTYANIGVYDTALFGELPRGTKLKLLPLFRDWIGRGLASGERYDGPWANVGTPGDLASLDAAIRQRARLT